MAPAEVKAQARNASGDAFRTAILIAAGLLVAGAAANAVGIDAQARVKAGAPSAEKLEKEAQVE